MESKDKYDIQRFVVTEIEYVFGVCRCIFDLFQYIVKKFWDNVKLLDLSTRKQQLPDSFDDMIHKANVLRRPDELEQKYGLPRQWAEYYLQTADFFSKLRDFRNKIEHHGFTPCIIFITEKGFAVNADYKPFNSFNVWNETTFLPNKLAPIRPVIAYIIRETLISMDRFVKIIARFIKFPEDLAPGYHVYIHGPHIYRLVALDEYIATKVWECMSD